ncbi:presenilin family intramembrane aspartyl protease PSH [Natronorubrum thiooxidans]|uniref:Presenilin-like membrane protease, A22 family n=1 Tax=Natronorubrum thiooxidans TaxID=308853 RepID=A0A1N7E7R7_9EURY|nr:presenilin family intramembrane aspartyl protease PSH [Natronorubrum thiooxidans]SIR84193.1 Presenilin-like membrane protease, A22 family [Natronorubrum thiooxidans]
MNHRTRVLLAVGVTVVLFLGVQFGALALIEPFHESERQAVENPDDPTNSVVYFAIILVATAFMLVTFKYDAQWLIKALIIGVSVMLAWFVFTELVPPVVTVGSVNIVAALGAIAVGAGLLFYPEWYVIDSTGVVMGAGAAALFGISFGLLPAILLLAVLAVYDAISVYRTEHMLDLAEGVMDLKIPVVLVIPTSLSFSYLESGSTDGVIDDKSDSSDAEADATSDSSTDADTDDAAAGTDDSETDAETDAGALERDALFIGLGDAVIPTILVASAAYFLEIEPIAVPGVALNVPALGAILGTIAGLLVLMHMVLKGKPHAGLPLLNGGAIGGYLLGAVASGLSLVTALGL